MPHALNSEVEYLLTLEAIRERSRLVYQAALDGRLNSFDYNSDRMSVVADFVCGIIRRDFGPDRYSEIPPHGRWQHFNVGGIDRISPLLEEWKSEGCDDVEITRRLVDLFFVSVLLDAGAGDAWMFKEESTGRFYNRSEGIAIASLYMFLAGAFSTSDERAASVDAQGLVELSESAFSKFFQLSPENSLVGVSTRVQLLNNVGRSLLGLSNVVGKRGRPGNLVDYLLFSKSNGQIDYRTMWSVLQMILIPAWPKDRPSIAGCPIGDAWPVKVLSQRAVEAGCHDDLSMSVQPFHKLTQWLGYSLTVPFDRILGVAVHNQDLGTGLPEYRNGGLFVDLGALQLKAPALETGCLASKQELPIFSATSDTIIEWRGMTVPLLDELFKIVSARFAEQGVQLTMAQMLEAGTWKGGRELAAKYRPTTKSSPILIDGDGSLF